MCCMELWQINLVYDCFFFFNDESWENIKTNMYVNKNVQFKSLLISLNNIKSRQKSEKIFKWSVLVPWAKVQNKDLLRKMVF